MHLLRALEAFCDSAAIGRGERLVVAFSGGGDSTALLWGLARLAPARGFQLIAAHLDHGMDAGSAARAARAARLARRLGVPVVAARRPLAGWRACGESPEAAGRRIRYRFLSEVRRDARARLVVTAHTLDDQAETVLLRLRFGSTLAGLAGIQPASGPLHRPLLRTPRLALRAALAAAGLQPIEDPGNTNPCQPRSRIRHHVLPALARAERWPTAGGAGGACTDSATAGPGAAASGHDAGDRAAAGELAALLGRVAESARRARPVLDRLLRTAIDFQETGEGGVSAAGSRLAALPEPLLPYALAAVHRQAAAAYPASRAAVAELLRQLRRAHAAPDGDGPAAAPAPPHAGQAAASGAGCDCGAGWRWRERKGRVYLQPGERAAGETAQRHQKPSPGAAGAGKRLEVEEKDETAAWFEYTLTGPGEVAIPELGVVVRVSEQGVAPWMLRGERTRAGLALPPEPMRGPGPVLTVRNRRPGDRMRPLGAPGSRKLKEVLIDRKVPQAQRDRLPLLCWAGQIAWVPGVAIDHRFRLHDQATAWVVELFAAGRESPPQVRGSDVGRDVPSRARLSGLCEEL